MCDVRSSTTEDLLPELPPEGGMMSEAQSMQNGDRRSDEDLVQEANKLFQDDKLLAAARLLSLVQDESLLTGKHKWMLEKAKRFEAVVQELSSDPGPEWTKQGESHGKRDTVIYYQVQQSKLTARIETPIEQSLLVPLLAVFNESDLYITWIPNFEYPIKLGMTKSVKLRQEGRCHQLILASAYMPWPLSTREVVIDAMAIDDIDANGAIVVKMEAGSSNDPDVPPKETPDTVRADFDGGIVFRKCPRDHPALLHSNRERNSDSHDELILVCLTMYVDSHISFVPIELINFVTRSVLGIMWAQLLRVAQDVREGKREQHTAAIQAKQELYAWIEERVQVLLSKPDENNCNDAGETKAEKNLGEGRTKKRSKRRLRKLTANDIEELRFINYLGS